MPAVTFLMLTLHFTPLEMWDIPAHRSITCFKEASSSHRSFCSSQCRASWHLHWTLQQRLGHLLSLKLFWHFCCLRVRLKEGSFVMCKSNNHNRDTLLPAGMFGTCWECPVLLGSCPRLPKLRQKSSWGCTFGGFLESSSKIAEILLSTVLTAHVNGQAALWENPAAQKFKVAQSLTIHNAGFPQINRKDSFCLTLHVVFLWDPSKSRAASLQFHHPLCAGASGHQYHGFLCTQCTLGLG